MANPKITKRTIDIYLNKEEEAFLQEYTAKHNAWLCGPDNKTCSRKPRTVEEMLISLLSMKIFELSHNG